MSISGGIFSGPLGSHAFVLSADGVLYAIGDNFRSQLGIGDDTDRTTLSPVDFFSGRRVDYLSCGFEHTMSFNRYNGTTFLFGKNYEGDDLIKWAKGDILSPLQVEAFQDTKIAQICCAAEETYFLTEEGVVYSLGFGGSSSEVANPVAVAIPEGVIVRQIASGMSFLTFLSETGDVYTMSTDYVLRLDEWRNQPQRIDLRRHGEGEKVRIKQISCSMDYSFAIDEEGRLFVWCCDTATRGWATESEQPRHIELFTDLGFSVEDAKGGELDFFVILSKDRRKHVLRFCFGDISSLLSREMEWNILNESLLLKGFSVGVEHPYGIAVGRCHALILDCEGNCFKVGYFDIGEKESPCTAPLLLLEDTAMEIPRESIFKRLKDYILREQALEEGHRSTNSILKLVDMAGTALEVHVDKDFVEARFGEDISVISTASDLLASDDAANEFLTLLYSGGSGGFNFPFRRSVEQALVWLYENKSDRNVVITSSAGEIRRHFAHRFILVAMKDYFRAALSSDWVEGVSGEMRLEMPLGAPFEAYLFSLYTGRGYHLSSEDPRAILSYIDYFDEGTEDGEYLRKWINGS